MKTFCYFLIGAVVIFMLLSFQSIQHARNLPSDIGSYSLSKCQLDSLAHGSPITISIQQPSAAGSGETTKTYIISLIGGLVIAVFTKLLHHWLPSWFPDHFNP
jgi:hypothetical protein